MNILNISTNHINPKFFYFVEDNDLIVSEKNERFTDDWECVLKADSCYYYGFSNGEEWYIDALNIATTNDCDLMHFHKKGHLYKGLSSDFTERPFTVSVTLHYTSESDEVTIVRTCNATSYGEADDIVYTLLNIDLESDEFIGSTTSDSNYYKQS